MERDPPPLDGGVGGGVGDGDRSDGGVDDDCTGGSAYMDTSQFLRTKVPVLCSQQQHHQPAGPLDPFFTLDDGSPFSDEKEDNLTPTEIGEGRVSAEFGPYEFPSALANYPTSHGGDGVEKTARREGVDEIKPAAGQSVVYLSCSWMHVL